MREELEGERESIEGKLRVQEAVMQEALLSQCARYSVDYTFICIQGLISLSLSPSRAHALSNFSHPQQKNEREREREREREYVCI